MNDEERRKVVVIGLDCLEPTLLFEASGGSVPTWNGS